MKTGDAIYIGYVPPGCHDVIFEPKDVSCHTGEPPKIYMNMYVIVYVHLEPQ